MDVAVAETTVADDVLNVTAFPDAEGEKLLPVMITVSPALPPLGEKLVMTGSVVGVLGTKLSGLHDDRKTTAITAISVSRNFIDISF